MKRIRGLSEEDEIVRTQITLTQSLKKLIEQGAALKGESLSAYLRRAAMISLLVEENEKEELKRLADVVIGSIDLRKHPEWRTPKLVHKWVRNLRKEWKKR